MVVERSQKKRKVWRLSPWRDHAGMKSGLHLGGGVDSEIAVCEERLDVLIGIKNFRLSFVCSKLGGQGKRL